MRGRLFQFVVGGYVAVCLMATPAMSQDAMSDLGKNLSNPVASLISVPFQFNHNEGLAGGNGTQGLGNVVQSFFFSPKEPTAGGLVWGAGPVFQFPTSSDDLLGPKQFGAGITAVGLIQKNGWTYGMLANRNWSIDQEAKYGESSNTFLQPFVSYSASRRTSVTLNTESTYNWVNKESSVPVNLSLGHRDAAARDSLLPITPGGRQ